MRSAVACQFRRTSRGAGGGHSRLSRSVAMSVASVPASSSVAAPALGDKERKVELVRDEDFDVARCFVTARGTVPLLIVSGHGALLLCRVSRVYVCVLTSLQADA